MGRKLIVELAGDWYNKKGNLTFDLSGDQAKLGAERHNLLDDSWTKSWQEEGDTVCASQVMPKPEITNLGTSHGR